MPTKMYSDMAPHHRKQRTHFYSKQFCSEPKVTLPFESSGRTYQQNNFVFSERLREMACFSGLFSREQRTSFSRQQFHFRHTAQRQCRGVNLPLIALCNLGESKRRVPQRINNEWEWHNGWRRPLPFSLIGWCESAARADVRVRYSWWSNGCVAKLRSKVKQSVTLLDCFRTLSATSDRDVLWKHSQSFRILINE